MAIHVSLGFSKLSDGNFGDFAVGVHDAQVANAATFTSPPVTPAALQAATNDFVSKAAVAVDGSQAQTDARIAARAVVDGLLRLLANYVEGKAQLANNPALITLGGFQPASHAHGAQTALVKPSILAILNNATTQLQLRVSAVTNAKSFELQSRVGAGAWTAAGTFPSTRAIVVTGLTPGTLYEFRVRAIGGSTGSSDWSDSVSHMAM